SADRTLLPGRPDWLSVLWLAHQVSQIGGANSFFDPEKILKFTLARFWYKMVSDGEAGPSCLNWARAVGRRQYEIWPRYVANCRAARTRRRIVSSRPQADHARREKTDDRVSASG